MPSGNGTNITNGEKLATKLLQEALQFMEERVATEASVENCIAATIEPYGEDRNFLRAIVDQMNMTTVALDTRIIHPSTAYSSFILVGRMIERHIQSEASAKGKSS
jgi:hypothetical protein